MAKIETNTISQYFNGNLEARVIQGTDCFVLEKYSGGRIIEKTRHSSLALAENLAEDFVNENSGFNPDARLLNE